MSLFQDAADALATPRQADPDDGPAPVPTDGGDGTTRQSTVPVAGEQVPIEPPETVKTGEEGSWLTGTGQHGRPRGRDALEARQIVQTSAMQAIANGITDQLVGGDLAFESEDDELGGAEQELRALLEEVIRGPHLGNKDLDDLITAAVEDMLGPGNAYWQLHPAADGSLPVVALSTLDALTIRHNVNRHGLPLDPPYWQAHGAFSNSGVASLGGTDPVKLQDSDIAVMHYPRGNRSYSYYPTSPAQQVKEWLKILSDSTTHHSRFYSDDETPPGILQIIGAQNLDGVKDRIEAASGDPRDVPVIGGDGGAQWIDMGGTAVNLDMIEEQRWFFQLCLASLGLGKQELGFIEDVNRSNGEVEAERIYKRVKGPFAKQFQNAFSHVAEQFDVYTALDRPFDITLRFADPGQERAREERLRKMYNDGGLTLRQYIKRRGDTDLADNELTVMLGGQEVAYGDHPKHVVDHLLREARSDNEADADMADEDGED